jgi:hypothetical protein
VQGAGTAAVAGMSGAITGWFDHRNARKQRQQSLGAGTHYTTDSSHPPADPEYPVYGNDPQYPGPAPAQGSSDYPSYPSYPDAGNSQVYAGVAFEIYTLGPGGPMRVDPATHYFRTGEKFRIAYRPALPGRVNVYNINPSGQYSQVDTVNVDVASAQLVNLGPYQFADQPGDETLILELSPCQTDNMLSVTRSIVKADSAQGMNAGFQLSSCGTAVTRGLANKPPPTTRTIKIATEDGTSYALDPLSSTELQTGQVSPRQVVITLMHR